MNGVTCGIDAREAFSLCSEGAIIGPPQAEDLPASGPVLSPHADTVAVPVGAIEERSHGRTTSAQSSPCQIERRIIYARVVDRGRRAKPREPLPFADLLAEGDER